MPSPTSIAVLLIEAVFLVWAWRFVARRSPRAGYLVAFTIGAMAAAAPAMFLISNWKLPVLMPLQSGDGFWWFAQDSRQYFELAARAVREGFPSIATTDPSPAYVRILAGWMMLAGISPVAGAMLNVAAYAAVAVLLASVFSPGRRTDEPVLLAVLVPLSLSPALFVHSTQVLKDELFAGLCVAACLACASATSAVRRGRGGYVAAFAACVAAYLMAGIRSYVVAIFWACLALSLAMYAVRARDLWRSYGIRAAALLTVLAASYSLGAGLNYVGPDLQTLRHPLVALRSDVNAIRLARATFEQLPGRTNIVVAPATGPDAIDEKAPAGKRRAKELLIDLAAFFVPMSLLRMASAVNLSGGGTALLLADIDTIFMDATIAVAVALTLSRWRQREGNALVALFLCVLGSVLAALMAVVVLNLGTMVRLRVIAAIPFWLLPMAVSPRFSSDMTP